jgi:hypothetical protein
MQPHLLIYTEHGFGALAANLGCFPLDHEAYPSQSDSQDIPTVFGVCLGEVGYAPPQPEQ